jgi:hypothetical protein
VSDFSTTNIVHQERSSGCGESQSFVVRAVYLALGLALVLYLAQACTPLRLNTDAIDYLSLADGAARGSGFSGLWRADFHFPKGYPAFAYLMMKGGIFSPAALVISNLLLFGAGLWFSFLTVIDLGFSRTSAAVACLLTLFSFAAIKHVTQGMSDFLFFALSACACWLMTRQGPYRWVVLLPCVALAMETRLAGLALAIPLFVTAWEQVKEHPIAVALAGSAAIVCVAIGIWAGRHYVAADIQYLGMTRVADAALLAVISHCQDFGELIFNVPMSKVPAAWASIWLLAGGVTLGLFLAGAFTLRRRSVWLAAYLFACSALVLPWPFTDVRFWLPVMPFVFLAIWSGLTSLRGLTPRVASAYVVIFCVLGLLALGYSTWLTFSGPNFARRYGDGALQATYLTGCSPAAAGAVNDRALELLRRYEWHCQ